jgi:hypothetical protein
MFIVYDRYYLNSIDIDILEKLDLSIKRAIVGNYSFID